jgi:hypothetical protein
MLVGYDYFIGDSTGWSSVWPIFKNKVKKMNKDRLYFQDEDEEEMEDEE